MIGCLDVHYANGNATTAAVVFDHWQSGSAVRTFVHHGRCAADYQAGMFYKRELPCLLSALELLVELPGTILVDAHVWLSPDADKPNPGLGAHLFEALDRKIAVIGVAKSRYRENAAIEVVRGKSKRPLFITAAGIEPMIAAEYIRQMHGEFRLPTMIILTDQLARIKHAP